jgi:multicomponent K+:H+ antiporter subunit A
MVGLLGIAATLGTVLAYRHRLLALLLMGAAGLVVCLTFLWFSAPDLALTQLLVEVATVLLMMLALHWLPPQSPHEAASSTAPGSAPRRPRRHGRDAVLALAVGVGVTALVWMVLTRPSPSVSDYFLQTARTLGGGSNAVNVIIVDYRGFDTLGEITVLVIAGLLLHALLAGFRPAPHLGSTAGLALPAGLEAGRSPLMLQLVARLVLPFTALFAFYLYLRGHNLPGGGFIAGLVLAIGMLLVQVAHGQAWAAQRGGLLAGSDYRAWLGWGLLIAAASGMGSWLFGAPFLTSTYDYPWLPGVGGVPLASASAFDLGVFVVVVGATMVMLLSIARLSRVPFSGSGPSALPGGPR